jgi:hypothetical protein
MRLWQWRGYIAMGLSRVDRYDELRGMSKRFGSLWMKPLVCRLGADI